MISSSPMGQQPTQPAARLTADQIKSRMATLLPAWEEAEDRRCVFLRCYYDETVSVSKAIADGRFHNGPWVDDLLVRFATFYFNALDGFEAPSAVPPVWHWAFHLAVTHTTTVSEDLVLGINAHISRDLAMALRDSLQDEGVEMTPEETKRRLADFNVVNQLIAETAIVAQRDVLGRYSHLMRDMCVVCRPFVPPMRWAIEQVIGRWREQAWLYALELLASTDEEETRQLEEEIESHAVARVHLVINVSEKQGHLLTLPRRELARMHVPGMHREGCQQHPLPAVLTAGQRSTLN